MRHERIRTGSEHGTQKIGVTDFSIAKDLRPAPHSVLRRLTMSGRRLWRWAVLASVLLAFCGLSALTLLELRKDAWQQATTGARNLATVLSQDIGRNFRSYDATLQRVAGLIGNPSFAALSPDLQQKILFEGAYVDRYFASLLVLDRNGDIVRDRDSYPPRKANLADRNYFNALKDRRDSELAVSEPFRRRVTGTDDVVALSRRLETPDGTFAGVVVGTVRLDFFRDLLKAARLGEDDALNVFLDRGVMVMRNPEEPDKIGRDFSGTPNVRRFMQEKSGLFSGVSAVDGVRRVYSFDHVADLPLIIDVALSEDGIFVMWRRLAVGVGIGLTALCTLAFMIAGSMRRDLRRRLAADEAIRQSEARLRLLADNTTDLIICLDENRRRRYVSPASRALLGVSPEELLGRRSQDLIHPDDMALVDRIVANARCRDGETEAVYRLRHADGHYVWMEGRYNFVVQDNAFIVVLRDISRRKEAEIRLAAAHAELSALANTDGLTGLANRRRFDEAIRAACDRDRGEAPVSLLLLDIDRFKLFNDRYGHPAGDECLRRVADAIRGELGGLDALAARYGGEELAILLPSMAAAEAASVAEAVRLAIMSRQLPHEGNAANGGIVTVSGGLAGLLPDMDTDGQTVADRLVAETDRLLYEAKRLGRNRIVSEASLLAESPAMDGQEEEARVQATEDFIRSGRRIAAGSLDAIAASAAKLLGAPIGLVTLIGEDTAHLVGRHGTETVELKRRESFCSHVIQGEEPLVVADLARDPRFRDNPLVKSGTPFRFYAGAPLFHPETGSAVGAVCVLDFAPRDDFGDENRRVLTALSSIVATQFAAAR